MKNYNNIFYLLIVLLLSGCGPVISEQVRRDSDTTLTFKEVLQNPSAFKNRRVIWGGEVIETVNRKEGDTQIIVLQTPLSRRGEPREAQTSEGRFIFQASSYLDPQVYKKGRRVTVAGEIIGELSRPVGEMSYRYPVLNSLEMFLWEDYADYPPYFPYSYYYGGGYSKGYGSTGKYKTK